MAQALIGQEPPELALGLKGYAFNDWQSEFNHGHLIRTATGQLEISYMVPSCIA